METLCSADPFYLSQISILLDSKLARVYSLISGIFWLFCLWLRTPHVIYLCYHYILDASTVVEINTQMAICVCSIIGREIKMPEHTTTFWVKHIGYKADTRQTLRHQTTATPVTMHNAATMNNVAGAC